MQRNCILGQPIVPLIETMALRAAIRTPIYLVWQYRYYAEDRGILSKIKDTHQLADCTDISEQREKRARTS